MLSRSLESLLQWFEAKRLSGEAFSPEGAKAFADALKAAVETAVTLEAAAIAPVHKMTPEQIESVVLFPLVPRPTAFAGRQTNDGGDVA